MGVFFVFPLDEMDDGRHPLSFAVSLLFFVTFLFDASRHRRLEKMVVFVALRAARKKKKTKTTKEEEDER